MDKNEMPISLSAAMKKVTSRLFLFGERAKRAVRTGSLKVAKVLQDAARVLRIVIFLRPIKDFSSVLGLCGIENPSGEMKNDRELQLCEWKNDAISAD